MTITDLLRRLAGRRRVRRAHPEMPAGWTTREWADLPIHHPRRDEDALH